MRNLRVKDSNSSLLNSAWDSSLPTTLKYMEFCCRTSVVVKEISVMQRNGRKSKSTCIHPFTFRRLQQNDIYGGLIIVPTCRSLVLDIHRNER